MLEAINYSLPLSKFISCRIQLLSGTLLVFFRYQGYRLYSSVIRDTTCILLLSGTPLVFFRYQGYRLYFFQFCKCFIVSQ